MSILSEARKGNVDDNNKQFRAIIEKQKAQAYTPATQMAKDYTHSGYSEDSEAAVLRRLGYTEEDIKAYMDK